jgi:NDP-sugar pyrophosphorylase family protein
VINAHHLAGKLESMFATGAYAGRPLRVVFEPDLLEIGGGIKNVEDILGDEPFLVYSGDVLTDIDLARLVEEHFQRGNDVTLALRKTGLTTHIAFQEDRVVDIKNQIGTGITGNYDFANVSVWNPEIFGRIPIGKKVSFVPVLVDWIRAGGRIGGVVLERGEWFNISSRKEYLDVHREIVHQGWRPEYVGEPLWPLQVSNEATVARSARLIGVNYLSPGCVVESDATLEDCVLWSRSRITTGTKLKRCVVARATPISGEYTDFDFV